MATTISQIEDINLLNKSEIINGKSTTIRKNSNKDNVSKRTKVLKGVGIGVGCVASVAIIESIITAYFYRRTMVRQRADVKRTIKMAGTDWDQYMDIIAQRKKFMLEQPHEDMYQTSFDGLNLHATYFPAINDKKNNKRVVICFHGYTSQGLKDFIGLTDYYFKRGYAMLHPDARAHGASEGDYVGFGCLDRKDALGWINQIIDKCGEDVEIYLHGISMGGATVLMASGLELPSQVKGIISDCAFTSPKEVFTHVLRSMYHMPAFPIIQGANLLNKKLAGYGTDECNASREIVNTTIPILFIHGSGDTFVPVAMCHKLYDVCGAPKKKLIIEGAAHAESYFKDMEAYEKALDEFTKEL
ncbi:MAG: alpha/beta hydrolase [Lachnospiraceae bacterium]|nr:alpha/beta hydrolase [Lachnospiraceae bacterium]